jgi:hypothetical protein
MALPMNLGSEPQTAPPNESYLHYLARESRGAMRWCIFVCIIGIVVTMVSPLWFVAIVPAAVMLVCGMLLYVANTVERRSDPEAHRALEQAENAGEADVVDDMADAHQFAPRTVRVLKREGAWGVVLLSFVLLAALLVAFIFVPTPVFAIGALVVFAYMLLVCAPALLGAFNDDIEYHDVEVENEGPQSVSNSGGGGPIERPVDRQHVHASPPLG